MYLLQYQEYFVLIDGDAITPQYDDWHVRLLAHEVQQRRSRTSLFPGTVRSRSRVVLNHYIHPFHLSKALSKIRCILEEQ